jgi:hypothetical protein
VPHRSHDVYSAPAYAIASAARGEPPPYRIAGGHSASQWFSLTLFSLYSRGGVGVDAWTRAGADAAEDGVCPIETLKSLLNFEEPVDTHSEILLNCKHPIETLLKVLVEF